MADGEIADVVFSTVSGIETLVKDGRLIAGTGAPIASSGMGVAESDISTPEAFKQALRDGRGIAYTDPASGGASGIQFANTLHRLAIANEVNAKAKLSSVFSSATCVVNGEVRLAIQQIPEPLSVWGVELVGPPPAHLQHVTEFTGGVHIGSANPYAGRALIKFLQTPDAITAIKANGLESRSITFT